MAKRKLRILKRDRIRRMQTDYEKEMKKKGLKTYHLNIREMDTLQKEKKISSWLKKKFERLKRRASAENPDIVEIDEKGRTITHMGPGREAYKVTEQNGIVTKRLSEKNLKIDVVKKEKRRDWDAGKQAFEKGLPVVEPISFELKGDEIIWKEKKFGKSYTKLARELSRKELVTMEKSMERTLDTFIESGEMPQDFHVTNLLYDIESDESRLTDQGTLDKVTNPKRVKAKAMSEYYTNMSINASKLKSRGLKTPFTSDEYIKHLENKAENWFKLGNKIPRKQRKDKY